MLEVAYVGHSSYLISAGETHVLVDPCFDDVIMAGTAAVTPSRQIDFGAFPALSAVVITHFHPGHLEIPALAELARDIPVLCPDDPLIVRALQQMRFTELHHPPMWAAVEFGGMELHLVPSRDVSRLAEFGLFVTAGGASALLAFDCDWDAETMRAVRCRWDGRIDLFLCNYPAYHHDFFKRLDRSYPYEAMRYSLQLVGHVDAAVCSPTFANVRYRDEAAWINAVMFPMDEADFIAECQELYPRTRFAPTLPGECWQIDGHEVSASTVPYVRLTGEREPAFYDEGAGMPPLVDSDAVGLRLTPAECRAGAERVLTRFCEWLRAQLRDPLSDVATERDGTSGFLLILADAAGGERRLFFDYGVVERGGSWAEVAAGRRPLRCRVVLRIAESVLVRWAAAEVPYYYVYLHSRPSLFAFAVSRAGSVVAVTPVGSGRDPLALFTRDLGVFTHWMDAEAARYARHPARIRAAHFAPA